MGRLTTHVLDTSLGRPGAGIDVTVYRVGDVRVRVASAFTNADGRTDRP
ncbi:MAG TPA: hydroxyisourate hydrolase, partial [Casimicrobiaceae bacterium]|nr:hydroxyisourate hydrolase [Casimicrobiaceae bacterium]